MVVVSGRRSVGGTVTFTSGLDPDDGVNEAGDGAGGGASSETGTLDVAPVTPLLTDVLDTRAPLVNDEVSRETALRQHGCKGLNVEELVVVGVALSDGVGSGYALDSVRRT